ncbi:unnamed protein product [Cochlearia groenlandica]
MWKKGEIVWVSLNLSDNWIPGRILNRSKTYGLFVSFFDLMQPRYVPELCLRRFERDFEALISDSWKIRRFVNRALRSHFWNISYELWCPCQRPIDSPYVDRELSLPCLPLDSDSSLCFVRDLAVSPRVSLRRLAEINSSCARILSFRRYNVDFQRSESVYKQIIESAKLLDGSEETDWCLDPSNKIGFVDMVTMFTKTMDTDVDDSRDLSLGDLFSKDVLCCSSPCSEQPVDKTVQRCTWSTKNHLTSSDSSFIKACVTMAPAADHEDVSHALESRERCQVSPSIAVSEALLDVVTETHDDVTCSDDIMVTPSTAVSEAPLDVVTETHDDTTGLNGRTVTSAKQTPPLLDVSEEEAFMGESVSFVVTEACKNLACSVKETNVSPTKMLDSSMVSAKTLDVEPSDKNTFRVTLESCSDHVLESHIVETSKVSLHNTGSSDKAMSSDDIDVAPAKQLRDLEPATTNDLEPATTNQTQAVDNNVRSIGVKRKASQDKAGNSKRKKKAKQQSSSNDKQQNLHLMKDTRLADPKCLRMKFLSRHGNHPSKSELLKRFSVFGKIDASRTDVNIGESSAKVVFLQSIDAVTAFQFARTKKFTLGRSKVRYWLDPFEQDNEVKQVPVSQNLQEHTPSPRSCLKEHGSVDKEERRRNLKVKFQMETN